MEKWEKGLWDKRCFDFGDKIILMNKVKIFIHLPSRNEIIKMLNKEGLYLREDYMRSEIIQENVQTLSYAAGDCRFNVAMKIDYK